MELKIEYNHDTKIGVVVVACDVARALDLAGELAKIRYPKQKELTPTRILTRMAAGLNDWIEI